MRETKEIKTKGGHIAVVYSYITGKDQREYQKVLYSALKLNMESSEKDLMQKVAPKIEEISADILLDLDEKVIELLVVSVDGKNENVKEELCNLNAADYEEVVEELRLFFRQ